MPKYIVISGRKQSGKTTKDVDVIRARIIKNDILKMKLIKPENVCVDG